MNTTPPITDSKKRKTRDNDSVVYFLIVCHGNYVFKDDKPEYVTISKEIQYVNKITYAPFGFKNILPNVLSIRNNVTNICSDICPSNNLQASDDFIKSLDDRVKVLENQRNSFEIMKRSKAIHGSESNTAFETRCLYKMLLDKKDQHYQNVIYSSNEQQCNIPIIQKQFSISPGERNTAFNIYVVFEKNGKLQQDENGCKKISTRNLYRKFFPVESRK